MIKYLTRFKTVIPQTLLQVSKFSNLKNIQTSLPAFKFATSSSSSSSSQTGNRAINSSILSGANAAYLET